MGTVFEDRRDAGRRLAVRLLRFAGERPVVVGLPRGGVPVAAEIARELDAPLDVLGVRKLGAPANPEAGFGAVSEDGTTVVHAALASHVGVTPQDAERMRESALDALRGRMAGFRAVRAPVDVRDRTVIVVDDGLATGLSDLAAVRALRGRGAARLIVAVPVGSRQAVALLRGEADVVVCLASPPSFGAVGRWYRDFSPVSDDEVVALLRAESGQRKPS